MSELYQSLLGRTCRVRKDTSEDDPSYEVLKPWEGLECEIVAVYLNKEGNVRLMLRYPKSGAVLLNVSPVVLCVDGIGQPTPYRGP